MMALAPSPNCAPPGEHEYHGPVHSNHYGCKHAHKRIDRAARTNVTADAFASAAVSATDAASSL